MESFSVGEIAILIGGRFHSLEHPIEVLVVGPLATRSGAEPDGTSVYQRGYLIEIHGGKTAACEPQYLRKKRPPQETTSWESIEELTGWTPVKQPA